MKYQKYRHTVYLCSQNATVFVEPIDCNHHWVFLSIDEERQNLRKAAVAYNQDSGDTKGGRSLHV